MDIFVLFAILVNFLSGLAVFLTGFFLWRRFKKDFEVETIGGILVMLSILFFTMTVRYLLWDWGLIDEKKAFYMFFAQYIIILFPILPFAFPRFLYLVFDKPIMKKIGLVVGIGLYLIFLFIHFSQREQIVAHYTLRGLLFELPRLEKIFFLIILGLFLPMLFSRIIFHFYQWRKTKTLPYRFSSYLFMLFIASMASLGSLTRFEQWEGLLGAILMLAGALGLYFIVSQEVMKKEKLILGPEELEEETEEKVYRLEKLRKLNIEFQKEIEKLEKELKERK